MRRIELHAHTCLGGLGNGVASCNVCDAMMNVKGLRAPSNDMAVDVYFVAPGRRADKPDIQSNDRRLNAATGLQIAKRKAGGFKQMMRRMIDPGDQIRIVGDPGRIAVAELDPESPTVSLRGHDVVPDFCFPCASRNWP